MKLRNEIVLNIDEVPRNCLYQSIKSMMIASFIWNLKFESEFSEYCLFISESSPSRLPFYKKYQR